MELARFHRRPVGVCKPCSLACLPYDIIGASPIIGGSRLRKIDTKKAEELISLILEEMLGYT